MEESLNKETNKEKQPFSPKKKARRKGKAVVIRLPEKLILAIDHVIEQQGMSSRTEWIKQCIMRGLKNWKNPFDNPTLWPNCRHCGKHHDPAVHGE